MQIGPLWNSQQGRSGVFCSNYAAEGKRILTFFVTSFHLLSRAYFGAVPKLHHHHRVPQNNRPYRKTHLKPPETHSLRSNTQLIHSLCSTTILPVLPFSILSLLPVSLYSLCIIPHCGLSSLLLLSFLFPTLACLIDSPEFPLSFPIFHLYLAGRNPRQIWLLPIQTPTGPRMSTISCNESASWENNATRRTRSAQRSWRKRSWKVDGNDRPGEQVIFTFLFSFFVFFVLEIVPFDIPHSLPR